MRTKQEISQFNPLQRKAYKKINSLIDRRANSEQRWLYEQYVWQKREWERTIEKNAKVNYFDDQKQQKVEYSKYLLYLIEFGDREM